MPRIRIELPAQFSFSTDIMLYVGHMNYGGHLDNALLLSVVSEARARFFRSLGYSELDVEGLGIIIADAALQYRSEAFHGEVTRGKTGIVFFDYRLRQVAPVPEAFRSRATATSSPV